MNKISSMLDAVADSLEAKGYLKEAHEIDKVTDVLETDDTIETSVHRAGKCDRCGNPAYGGPLCTNCAHEDPSGPSIKPSFR